MPVAVQITVTAFVSALILLVEHWFPWRMALRRDLYKLAAYILGVMGLAAPLSVLFWLWAGWPDCPPYAHLVALWVVIVSGGLAVMVAYGVDWLLGKLAAARDLAELCDQLRNSDEEAYGPGFE